MTKRAEQQSWVVNTLLAGNGYEVLHPESRHFLAEIGYDPVDFDRALSRVKTSAQMPKAWGEVGSEIEHKATWYEAQGFRRAAHDLYHRSALLYGHARHSFAPGDSRKTAYTQAINRCSEGVARMGTTRSERIELPFRGQTLYATAHFPDTDEPAPLVLMLPGMDMYKEDWARVAEQYYLPRGMAVLAVDGPGQGETLTDQLFVTLENYEPAMSALIDELTSRPEIDADRVGLWGVSMGSYWGLRTAALDPRIKAAATAMGCYGDTQVIFNRAQPGFKKQFMAMSGIADEQVFEDEVATKMGVKQLADRISCPVLMCYGEFDELSTLEETIDLYEYIDAPKRLVVYEQEFHALGGVGAEIIGIAADWLEQALGDGIPAGADAQSYVGRDGTIVDGTARPPWWDGTEAPATVAPVA
ncbi:S9 family peptidase [Patulibacter sp.]|uniref:alpha/beta hydrolase family protein n=1 Tax=Patulibacter sp. TaxID=1912859 RepID=UPI00272434DC|nr:alpha/beta fold hydrolase [Patulibacter sp.]MDO9409010.1 alpha/beta fold hydrolase [Patulibacter sp.]